MKVELNFWDKWIAGLLEDRKIERVNAIVKKAHKGHHVSKNPKRKKEESKSGERDIL